MDNSKIGHHISEQFNKELEDMVKANFNSSFLKERIIYHIGDASDIIPGLNEQFDLVFIDADKKNNETYYKLIMNKLRPGGIVIVDNVLWSGKVLMEEKQPILLHPVEVNQKPCLREKGLSITQT